MENIITDRRASEEVIKLAYEKGLCEFIAYPSLLYIQQWLFQLEIYVIVSRYDDGVTPNRFTVHVDGHYIASDGDDWLDTLEVGLLYALKY